MKPIYVHCFQYRVIFYLAILLGHTSPLNQRLVPLFTVSRNMFIILIYLYGTYCYKHTRIIILLLSLNLSAAFDTIDHTILLNRFFSNFGIMGSSHNWLKSISPTGLSQSLLATLPLSYLLHLVVFPKAPS